MIPSLKGCKSPATSYLQGNHSTRPVLNRERKKKMLFTLKVLYKGGHANEDDAIGLWATGIGVLISLGLFTVEQGYTEEKEHATTCSLAKVKGRYLFATSRMIFPPVVPQPVVFARAGYRIFNGDGTGTVIATSSENGVIVQADTQSNLSYTVNKNCTGTYTLLPAGATPSVEIFVAPSGEEMVVIETVNGRSDDAHSSRRVGPE
jgi:hypothetical protein